MKVETLIARNPGPYTLDGTRTYLLNDVAVLDPGPALDDHIEAILTALPRLEAIVVTHRHGDHAGAVERLHQRTGAPVYAPAGVLTEAGAYHRVEDGDKIPVGDGSLEAIATPGHTSEHLCYLAEDGSLFTGDTILGEGTTTIFPPDGDMGDYLESLRKLRDRHPARIYPGHGKVREDAVALIDEYIAHREMREDQIVAALGEGAASPRELRQRIYPDLHPALHDAAEMQMQAHLDLLMRKKKVAAEGDRYGLQ